MVEKKLLLLGLLRTGDMYGYQLNEFIDTHLGTIVNLTKPTAYRLLKQMAEDGWVFFREERAGNRPPRRVFSISPEGEHIFQESMRTCLADFKPPEYASTICMSFLNEIGKAEAIVLLEKRAENISRIIKSMETESAHQSESINLVVDHHKRHLQFELDWLRELMEHISV